MMNFQIILVTLLLSACNAKKKADNFDVSSLLKVDEGNYQAKSIDVNTFVSLKKGDTIVVTDTFGNELVISSLVKDSSFNNYYWQLDSLFFIEQSIIGNEHLLIKVGAENCTETEFEPCYMLLIDMQERKTIMNIVVASRYDNYVGTSANGEFHVIEAGTSACQRDFKIYDSKGNVVKESDYFRCVSDSIKLAWVGDTLHYYTIDSDGVIPENLPQLKNDETYVHKVYWLNGRDSVTAGFAIASIE